MGYKIQSNKKGLFELVFIDEPEYCQALMMSPTLKEAKLSDGIWLILLFAVWSAPDQEAIKTAVTLAKKFNGKFQLGVRPFDEHQENGLWCPEIKEAFASPIWLVFENGQLIAEHVGLRSEELDNMIQNALESKRHLG
jgi:thioredoxin-like negative regulator of GroEL